MPTRGMTTSRFRKPLISLETPLAGDGKFLLLVSISASPARRVGSSALPYRRATAGDQFGNRRYPDGLTFFRSGACGLRFPAARRVSGARTEARKRRASYGRMSPAAKSWAAALLTVRLVTVFRF